MDQQKSNNGNQGNAGREGAGSSMGKDLSNAADSAIDKARDTGKDLGRDISSAAGYAADKAKELARDASGAVQTGATDIHNKIDQAVDAAKPIVERMASSAHAGVDKLSGAIAGATDGLDAKGRQLTQAARAFADSGRGYVRTSPATSVLVALGAGYLLSKLLGSRR
ncbi:hypothetical protein [Massilia sp. PWRC2]|uniref:hypothetical protein n=1 Tax=Massilia sp. PWRC2 TaxID=2804626 RepID=UPI003CF83B9D